MLWLLIVGGVIIFVVGYFIGYLVGEDRSFYSCRKGGPNGY